VRLVNLAMAEGELLPDAVSGVTRVVEDDEGAGTGNGVEPPAEPTPGDGA
jgi:hypothetical protein